jgi:hypothetical protein
MWTAGRRFHGPKLSTCTSMHLHTLSRDHVAAGACHSLAVTTGGWLYTWGAAHCGQVGHGGYYRDHEPLWRQERQVIARVDVQMAACGEHHTLAITSNVSLWACGTNMFDQLGLVDCYQDDDDFKLFQNREIQYNERGPPDETICLSVFVRVGAAEFGNSRIVEASAGWGHSAAVTECGSLPKSSCGVMV